MTNMAIFAASASTMEGEGVYNYALIVVLMMTGMYLILSKSNMVKSIIGLNLFQVSVIMFYVSMGRVEHGTAPILYEQDQHAEEHGEEHNEGDAEKHGTYSTTPADNLALVSAAGDGGKGVKLAPAAPKKDDSQGKAEIKQDRAAYSNPLPHVLMLTAIVVGVATTALALSLVIRVNEYYGTIEEDELEEKEAMS